MSIGISCDILERHFKKQFFFYSNSVYYHSIICFSIYLNNTTILYVSAMISVALIRRFGVEISAYKIELNRDNMFLFHKLILGNSQLCPPCQLGL